MRKVGGKGEAKRVGGDGARTGIGDANASGDGRKRTWTGGQRRHQRVIAQRDPDDSSVTDELQQVGLDGPVWRIGDRDLVRRPGDVLIATRGRWVLIEVSDHSTDEWRSVIVFHDNPKARKRAYRFGVNRKNRPSGSSEGRDLKTRFPHVWEWALRALEGAQEAENGGVGYPTT